jgi:hypothetical protein
MRRLIHAREGNARGLPFQVKHVAALSAKTRNTQSNAMCVTLSNVGLNKRRSSAGGRNPWKGTSTTAGTHTQSDQAPTVE